MNLRRFHPWIVFCALSLLFFLVSAGTFSSLGVVLPPMVRELNWTWTQAGLGYTVLGVSCGLTSFAPAVLIRRLGVSLTIAGGTALLVVGFAALALVHTATLYLLAMTSIGVGISLTTTVPGTHVLAALFTRRSTAFGAYFTIGALGGVAGPLLYVGVEGPAHQWRVYWWIFVVAAAGMGAITALVTPGRDTQRFPSQAAAPVGPVERLNGVQDWTVRRALATPQFYVIVGAYTMYLLINTTAHGFAVEHLSERGVPSHVAAGMLSLEALIGAVVSVIGGVIGEKVAAKTLLLLALAALTCGMAALAVATSYPMMLVYALGVGIGYGLSFLASTILLLKYFGQRANLELYSIMCVISTTAAVGPAFGGWARDTLGGFSSVFLLCSLATLSMLVITAFLSPPAPQSDGGGHLTEDPLANGHGGDPGLVGAPLGDLV